jgi:hypothetical protein
VQVTSFHRTTLLQNRGTTFAAQAATESEDSAIRAPTHISFVTVDTNFHVVVEELGVPVEHFFFRLHNRKNLFTATDAVHHGKQNQTKKYSGNADATITSR